MKSAKGQVGKEEEVLRNWSWLIASRREDIIKVPVEMRCNWFYILLLVNWMAESSRRLDGNLQCITETRLTGPSESGRTIVNI